MSVRFSVRILGFCILLFGWAPAAQSAEIHAYGFEDGSGSLVARDSVGSADGLLDSGMDTSGDWVPGKTGEAIRIRGTSADQQVEFVAYDFDLTDAGTIMAWVNADGAANPEGRVWMNGKDGTLGYLLLHVPGTSGLAVAEFSGNPNILVQPSFASDEWVHIAVTWEVGGNSTLYTNGDVMASQSFTTALPSSATLQKFRLGGDGTHLSRKFTGIIDELRVYDNALTQGEIQAVKDVAVPPPPPPGSSDEPLLLVHAYPMDEGGGSNVADIVGSVDGAFGGIGTPAWVAGQSGTALEFSGDAFVVMANDTSFEQNRGGTIMAWVQPDANEIQPEGSIWRKGSDSEGFAYLHIYDIDDGDAAARSELFSASGITRLNDGPPPPFPGQWAHLAVSWEANGLAVAYRNGALAAGPEILAGPLFTTAGQFSIGGDYTQGGAHSRHFHGIIDEVKIFSRFMTAEEVLEQSTNFLSVTEVAVSTTVSNLTAATVETAEDKQYRLAESTDLVADRPEASPDAIAVPGTGNPRVLIDPDAGADPVLFYSSEELEPEH